jgi:poly(3-hydroxyalkanoate) synthetase
MLDNEFACKPASKWLTGHTVIYSCAAFDLLCFRPANDKGPSIVNRPPEAGHGPDIVDFDFNQSVVQVQLDNTLGGVYVMAHKAANFLRTMEGISTIVKHVERAIYEVNDGPVHLVGFCQGGWVSALAATEYPHLVSELTIVATPIDTSFEGDLTPQGKIPLSMYAASIAMQGGLMRGYTMGKTWEYPNKKEHAAARKLPENKRFYQWYDTYQDISGLWVYEAADMIFCNNRLPKMLKILCPTNVIVGKKDKTTPAKQSIAIQNNCVHKVRVFRSAGGHLGAIMGRQVIAKVWPELLKGASL